MRQQQLLLLTAAERVGREGGCQEMFGGLVTAGHPERCCSATAAAAAAAVQWALSHPSQT